jgi:hypothetical protein
MSSVRICARGTTAVALLLVSSTIVRADVIVPDYGYFGTSQGIFDFNESTGAAVGTQPFIPPVGSPGNPYDPGYEGDGYQAEGSAYGPDGNLYVGYMIPQGNSDTGIGEVREYNAVTGAYVSTFVAPGSGGLVQPGDLTFNNGTLYVADHGNVPDPTSPTPVQYGGTSVYEYNASTGANTGEINFGYQASPSGLAFDPRPASLGGNPGNLYISLFNTNQVMQYNVNTHALSLFATGNDPAPGFSGLAFGPNANLYVVNLYASNVEQFNGSGTYLNTLPSTGTFSFPNGIAFTQGGQFLVSTLGPGAGPGTVLSYDAANSTWNTFLAPPAPASLGSPGPLTLTPIAGDANADGIVNGQDLAAIASNWLTSGPTGDVTHDGLVNGQDIALIASNWLNTNSIYGGGGGSGTSAAVPEPSTIVPGLSSALMGIAALARRRAFAK